MGVKYVTLHDNPYSDTKLLVQTTFPIGFIVRSGEEMNCNEHFGGVWQKLTNEVINETTVYRYKRVR